MKTMLKSGKMDSKVLITGIIVLGAIIVASVIAGRFGQVSMSNTISSTGQSTIKVLPDLIHVFFNVQTTGTTASSASDKNSEIVSKLKDSLTGMGFNDSEIMTDSFSVYPNYDYSGGSQRITGYTATHAISVKIPVEENDKVGNVIDAGINAGAGINYINYELTEDNQKKYKIQAITEATQDAKDKAEALAAGSGKSLGSLVTVSTNDFNYVPWLAYASDSGTGTSPGVKSGAEIATSITPSEQQISATVTAVYRIR